MRCRYREKKYLCGDNYMEVDIFPVFRNGKRRRGRYQPSTETQTKLNQINAERKLSMLVKKNFTPADIKCELTYSPENAPETEEQAARSVSNFFRRLKRLRKKKGLPELKYIEALAKGKRNKRLHHHVIMSGGITPQELAACWGKGYVMKIQPLQFDGNGVAGIATYFCKQTERGPETAYKKRWNSSRSLQRLEERKDDRRFSAKKAREIAKASEDRELFESLYPGWTFAGCRVLQNDFNGGVYMTIALYKPPGKRKG